MTAQIGAGISLDGMFDEDAQYPFNLAAGIVAADVGKAVTQDTSAANTVKLAGDGDPILGRLEVVEIRTQEGINVGTVSLCGGYSFPVKDGETVAVGDKLVGAGSGEVKAAALGVLTIAAGTADDTVADVGGTFNQATLNNDLADIATKVNSLIKAVSTGGWLVTEVATDGSSAVALRC